MPVNSTHPQYNYFINDWQRCRDCYEGQSFIKRCTTRYLPLLSSHDSYLDKDYIVYLQRASFLNSLRRTVQGLHGLIFRKDPVYTDSFEIGDLYQKSRELVSEVLKVGRCGILIDSDESGNARYVVYNAESIINWYENKFIVLRECVEVQNEDDPFTFTEKFQFRILRFNENGHYVQELRDESDNIIEPEKLIIVQDEPLYEFPFYIANVSYEGLKVESPPLIDLAAINISHYNNSADYENGLHFTALPTAVFSGFTQDDVKSSGGKIRLGSTAAIVARDPGANASYLEFTGAGLSQIKQAMSDKQDQMAALGARMLTPEKLAAETAESQMIKRNGELSSLATIANTLSEVLTKSGRMYLRWNGYRNYEEFSYELNTDFNPAGLSAQELQALVAAWQAGAISMNVLFYNLKQSEIIQNEMTLEEMQNDIEVDSASRSISLNDQNFNNYQEVIA